MTVAILVIGYVGVVVFVLACVADNRADTVRSAHLPKHRKRE